ncbi:glucosaminidase domain-containing protein [Flavobacterium orientale]|uniref:Peptidoglycan hydrolase n=1 Tax=Flavobacterium orientale TaxID=1756020 RepID=A0A916XVK7_9FLAO|nr:glucosaminidase domain-containing protein [Flavobacterium orientale]GGD14467.1 hemagglutinin [Flavobacterium orientale]
MIKKLSLLLLLFSIVACNTSKPVVRTTKSEPVTRTVRKPVAKTSSTTKPTTQYKTAPKTEVLHATSNVKVTTEIVLKYIDDFKDIAKNNMQQYGIPASITLAQAILESGSGLGSLSQRANNHFGIKCHKEWTGPSVAHDDDAAQECFRKYDHPSESFRDHSLFLTSRSRYSSLFQLPQDDYKAWARGLKAAGYATDPKYPDKLISLIERYQLQHYDQEVLGGLTSTSKNAVASVETPKNMQIYTVEKGDTLYGIARKFNMTVDEIKKKNNLRDSDLIIGQTLRL